MFIKRVPLSSDYLGDNWWYFWLFWFAAQIFITTFFRNSNQMSRNLEQFLQIPKLSNIKQQNDAGMSCFYLS